jgi:hypothetical protein
MKGYRTFARGARHVSIWERQGRVKFGPTKTTERGAFDDLPDRDLLVEKASLLELADAFERRWRGARRSFRRKGKPSI